MSLFAIFALPMTATALLAWVNERFIRLPSTVGVMAIALIVSVLQTIAGGAGLVVDGWAATSGRS